MLAAEKRTEPTMRSHGRRHAGPDQLVAEPVEGKLLCRISSRDRYEGEAKRRSGATCVKLVFEDVLDELAISADSAALDDRDPFRFGLAVPTDVEEFLQVKDRCRRGTRDRMG